MNSAARFCYSIGKPPRSGVRAPEVVRSDRMSSCISTKLKAFTYWRLEESEFPTSAF
jgi:hypothetical protein